MKKILWLAVVGIGLSGVAFTWERATDRQNLILRSAILGWEMRDKDCSKSDVTNTIHRILSR